GGAQHCYIIETDRPSAGVVGVGPVRSHVTVKTTASCRVLELAQDAETEAGIVIHAKSRCQAVGLWSKITSDCHGDSGRVVCERAAIDRILEPVIFAAGRGGAMVPPNHNV